MSSARQNRSIARLIVGAMTIDGSLDRAEREKVARTLDRIGMAELVADVGAAIDEDDGNFNMFAECKELIQSMGSEVIELSPLVFRVVTDVVAADRFVTIREAAYLSAMSKSLNIAVPMARAIFKQSMTEHRGRLEMSGKDIDAEVHPHLKDLLSFPGSDKLVGPAPQDSVDELFHSSSDITVSQEELERSLAILGLDPSARLSDAEAVWKETINNLDLPKMANLGETFVSAAINRISRVNDAYKSILAFHEQVREIRAAANKGFPHASSEPKKAIGA